MGKNICELCLSPDLGGLELYMMRTSRYLSEHGECLSVINSEGKLLGYYEGTSLRYETLRRRNVLFSWIGARRLARIIDEQEIDVVHLHWTKDLPLAIMAKVFSKRRPKVVQSRHMTMTRFKDSFYHRFLYKNLDMMLAVTQQVKSQIEKFIPKDICPPIEVLYIGADQPVIIDEQEKKKRRESLGLHESFTVGIFGRIELPKGQHIVLEAVQKLCNEGIDAKTLVVGHAMDEGYLSDLQIQYAQSAVFTGFTSEAQMMMQLCDVIVLATENETFGLVLIEAMMCGVSAIASNSGGPLEIIDDTINGYLFDPKVPDALHDLLYMLFENPMKRKEVALEGRRKALSSFNFEKHWQELKSVLLK